jgi:hypothetical protein
MKLRPEELRLALAYDAGRSFEGLSSEQTYRIISRGRELFKWHKAHIPLHNVINAAVLTLIFVVDGVTLLWLPSLFIADGATSVASVVAAAVVTAAVHGWLLYSLTVFSLHEGAAHMAIFVGSGRLAAIGEFLAANFCRVAQADPEYYAPCHMGHHSKFGTAHDPEFLNFVLPHRLWMSLLPFAAIVNLTDFVSHRPPTYTRSRVVTGIVAVTYQGVYAWLMYRRFGALLPLLTMVLVLNVAFYFDRLRQFSEHNLMPLENFVGARSLGIGFWGLLIGGGPWGQPCHLAHHMVPSVPWYQQIVLHRYIKSVLTPRQREQFLIAPVVGYPKELLRIVREANRFAREHREVTRTGV